MQNSSPNHYHRKPPDDPTIFKITNDHLRILEDAKDKYNDLIWYARSCPPDHPKWNGTPEDIKEGAFNNQVRVREKFPDEVEKLAGEDGQWQHGFNSGMLAGLRLSLGLIYRKRKLKDQDVSDLIEWFPMLDT